MNWQAVRTRAQNAHTYFLDEKEMPAAASAILAHELDTSKAPKVTASEREKEDFLRMQTARITRMAYGSKAQFLGLKSEALQLWTDALLDEYDRQKAEMAAAAPTTAAASSYPA